MVFAVARVSTSVAEASRARVAEDLAAANGHAERRIRLIACGALASKLLLLLISFFFELEAFYFFLMLLF